MRLHKLCAVLVSFTLTAGSLAHPAVTKQVQAAEQTAGNSENTSTGFVGLDAEYHTQEEIRENYRNHPIKNMETEYSRKPSVTVPFDLGELTEETKQNALNMLNLYRYIAGVPAVSITEEAQNYAQAASVAMAANRKLEHSVNRPTGMSDEMYQLAAYGAFNSNIAGGGSSLSNNIVRYMLETGGDSSNFGHRRQLLEYHYTEAGFGMAESGNGSTYSATFVDANLKEDKIIAYPAQNQPLEYFGTEYAWSVIVPEQVDKSKVHVKITNQKTGQIWEYDNSSKYMWVSNDQNCILFSPYGIEYREGDCYQVEITGINRPISYNVNFFLLDDPVPLEGIYSYIEAYYPSEGDTSYSCNVQYTPENATNKIVTWSSSDPDVAEPEWTGTGACSVVAKKAGTTVFIATSEDGGYTAQITIHVRPKPTSVILSETSVTIGVGQTFYLTGQTAPKEAGDSVSYLWDFDENIIDLEDRLGIMGKAKITGKAVGQTTVTGYANADSNVRASCRINVVEPVLTEKIVLDRTELEMMSEETVCLQTTVIPSDITCKEIMWSSSNQNVAEVENGRITPTGLGTAVITAKAMDGSKQEAKCTVTVYGKYEKKNAPRILSKTTDTVVLEKYSGCEFSMDKESWQDSNVFSGLEAGHSYTFYVRYKERGYMKAGDASEGTIVEIPLPFSEEDETIQTTKPALTQEPEDTTKPIEIIKPDSTQDPQDTTKPDETVKPMETVTPIQTTAPAQKPSETINPNSTQKPEDTVKPDETVTPIQTAAPAPTQKPDETTKPSSTHETEETKKPNTTVQPNQTTEPSQPPLDVPSDTGKTGQIVTKGIYSYRIMSASTVSMVKLKNKNAIKAVIPPTVKIAGKNYQVTAIGESAFKGCSKLSKVTIGKNVTKIGTDAFKKCKKLKNIIIQSDKLKSVGKNAFKGIKATARIKVPAKKLKAYKKLLKKKGQGKKVKIVK